MFKYVTTLKAALITAALSLVLSTSVNAVEADGNSAVSKNFKTVGRSLRGLGSAKSADDLVKTLAPIREAVVANKDEVPSFMTEGSEEFQAYQDGLDDFIGRIDEVIELAEGGDLDGAMAKASSLRDVRNEYHDKFNIEGN